MKSAKVVGALSTITLSTIITTAVLFVPLYPVFAQETDSATSKSNAYTRLQQRLAEKEAKVSQKVASTEARVKSKEEKLASQAAVREAKVLESKEARMEKIASKEAALKARLDKFKDQQKAKLTQKVDENLKKINQQLTGQMLAHLNKMSEIVTKAESRLQSSATSDKTSATTALAEAKTAIETAKEVVTAQGENDYTLSVTTESAVKKDAQGMRDTLHADLKAARDLVIAARNATAKAIEAVAKTTGRNNGEQ